MLIWQAKTMSTNPWGIFTINGSQAPTFSLVKKFMNALWENRAFLNSYHAMYNNDGFTASDNLFTETDAAVLTRHLGNYLAVYSTGPAQVSFANTGGLTLSNYAFDPGSSPPTLVQGSTTSTISGLVPNRLYLLSAANKRKSQLTSQ
jgi:hypothetical protein